MTGLPPAAAQDNVVQDFSGRGSSTTGLFKVQDRWEVRWNARQAVSVAVMSPSGTLVAGASGVLRGSLFVPLGGQYYLKISDGTVAPASGANTAPAAGAGSPFGTPVPGPGAGVATPYGTPMPGPGAGTPNGSSANPSDQGVTWHLQVVEMGKSVASGQDISVNSPWFIVPDSAVSPSPSASPPIPPPPPNVASPVLTKAQALTVVTIKGDNAQGTGFLMRSADGTFVVTHLQLLAANPNVKIFTRAGAPITVVSLKGAVDRDLALFAIKDDHFGYLPLATDAATSVQTGDQVIIPDLEAGTDDLVGKPVKVTGMAPDRIDFDSEMGPGGSGAPVIHAQSGKVLAMLTSLNPADLSALIARAWPSNQAAAGGTPCFGLPLYGVRAWETYDWSRFQAETVFLKQFHEDTRCLDSYLNGKRRHDRSVAGDSGPPDSRYYLSNIKIRDANISFQQAAPAPVPIWSSPFHDGDSAIQSSGGSDPNQILDAAKELLFDLQGVADGGVNTLQGQNLYGFDQIWARKELAYRKALKSELDDLGNNMSRLEDIAWSR